MLLNKWNNTFGWFSKNVFEVPFNLIILNNNKGMKTDIKTNQLKETMTQNNYLLLVQLNKTLEKMKNKNKTLEEMTTKLDEILDWLTDSPMDNKDYNQLHQIFNKYLKMEKKKA